MSFKSSHVLTLEKALGALFDAWFYDRVAWSWISRSVAESIEYQGTRGRNGYWATPNQPRAIDYTRDARWRESGWMPWGEKADDLYQLFHTGSGELGPIQVWVTLYRGETFPTHTIHGPFTIAFYDRARTLMQESVLSQAKARLRGKWRSKNGLLNKMVIRIPHR